VLRGYPSSLYLFAEFAEKNRVHLPKFKAIFTTAETLFSNYRAKIETVFDAPAFDGYSVRDGGASAMECEERQLHIATERSVVEFVKDTTFGKNRLILTDLWNYVFPFIRYDVGDIGLQSHKTCVCGRKLPSIAQLEGRVMDIIRFPNGTCWAGPALTLIFGKFDVKQYLVIQEDLSSIILRLVKGESFSEADAAQLIHVFKEAGASDVSIDFVDSINLTASGKRRFVISKI